MSHRPHTLFCRLAGPILVLAGLLIAGCAGLDLPKAGAQPTAAPHQERGTASASPQIVLPTSAPPEIAPKMVPLSPSPTTSAPSSPAQETLEAELERTPPSRDLRALHQRLAGEPQPATASANPGDSGFGSPRLGDRRSFWVTDYEKNSYLEVSATLRFVTSDAYFFIQDGYEVPGKVIEEAAQTFSNKIAPQLRRYFGSEWSPGIDNDPHIVILHAFINGPPGYFSGNDEYSRSINPYSNEHEMIYVNLGSTSIGSPGYYATLAHEFQHMIHWNNDVSEDAWVNEGLSELAVRLAGLDVDTLASFVPAPDTQLDTWDEDPVRALPHYGASYAFLSYLAEHYGEPTTLKDLVAVKKHGIAGVEDYLHTRGYSASFDDVFKDWVVANLLDDPRLDNGRYGYTTLDVHVVPQRLAALPAHIAGAVHQYAADYLELPPDVGDLTVTFVGKRQVKLIPNEPHSGREQWWSNRGDVMDTTLTRAFDLKGLDRATLRAWLWFDIEKDFDYAYVEASADGGQAWTILPGRQTTTLNPNGNSFGPAYTGESGGGPSPTWIEDDFDLTPFAGKKVIIRFEYITDDANNGNGFAVDDVSIPELEYVHDAESDGGWIANGFIRTDNCLSENYVVQLVTLGEETTVDTLPLDADRSGRWQLKSPAQGVRRILVISAMAPATTEEAPYELRVEMQSAAN